MDRLGAEVSTRFKRTHYRASTHRRGQTGFGHRRTSSQQFRLPSAATRISTSHIERANLTVRMHLRRFTRLTNGFSKKLENLKAAVSVFMAWYNFCRVHQTLRVTPAMEAGIADHVWSIEEIVRLA